MLDKLLSNLDKLDKVFAAFKVNMILGIIINLIIIIVLFKLTDIFISKLKNKFSTNENSSTIVHIFPILDKIIKSLIVFFIVASFLQSQGYSLTSLIAGFGITGLAFGFAAQETIASMFGTLGILTDKVYKTGDYIRVNNFEGIVENISLRSTKIRTLDHFVVSIPNSLIASNIVENITKAKKRRINTTFGITYDTENEKIQNAIDILKNIVQNRNDTLKDFIINIDALDSSSINIRLIVNVKTTSAIELAKVKSEIYFEAIKQFRAANISFAFPSQTIYIAKDEN